MSLAHLQPQKVYVEITLKPHHWKWETQRPQAKRALEVMLVFYPAAEFKMSPCVLKAVHTEWFQRAGWDWERSCCPAICPKAGTAAFFDRMTFWTYVYLTCFSDEGYSQIICSSSLIIYESALLQFQSLVAAEDKSFPPLWKTFTHFKIVIMSSQFYSL